MQMRRRAPLTCNAAQRALAPVPPAGAAPKQEAVQVRLRAAPRLDARVAQASGLINAFAHTRV